ncbi:MAG: hypothetical protein LAT79_10905, partial [Kiritimatiellae bacterium]|nr:hypothetical protein [Kiritimatiellia bacterium]
PSIETVRVDLRSDLFTQDTTVVNVDAILLENADNTVANELRVRTGGNVPTTLEQTTRDYNLVQTAAIDTDGRDLLVNAATGANHTGVLSPYDNSLLNGGEGSTITLDQEGNRFGLIRIRDASDTVLRSAETLILGESVVHGHLDMESGEGDLVLGANRDGSPAEVQIFGESRFVAVGSGGNILVPGNLQLGGDSIFAAGMDLTVDSGASVVGDGLVVMVVDENAGPLPGDGWFRNFGTIEGQGGVIVYAVGGPSVPGTHFPVQNQVELGSLIGLATLDPNLLAKYGVSYSEGGVAHGPGFAGAYLAGNGFAPMGSGIWYKLTPQLQPVPVVDTAISRRGGVEWGTPELPWLLPFHMERYWDWAGEREFDWFYSIRTEPGEWLDYLERRYLRQRSFINRPASDSGQGDRPIEAVEDTDNPELAFGE